MFKQKNFYTKKDIEKISIQGFGEGKPRLPTGRLLMFDEILNISNTGGKYQKGIVKAKLSTEKLKWVFPYHFTEDPLVPGSFLLEGLCQVTGFYLAWLGYIGKARALSVKDVSYAAEVTPNMRGISYEVNIQNVKRIKNGTSLVKASGLVLSDEKECVRVDNIIIGLIG